MRRHMESIYRIARCRHAIFRKFMCDYGVTLQQFHLLMGLKMKGRAKVSELSENMLVSTPTISRMINTLCDIGLVRKKKSGDDRRSTYVELTVKGERVLERMHQKQSSIVRSILESIAEEDMYAFVSVTERIADEMARKLEMEGLNGEG